LIKLDQFIGATEKYADELHSMREMKVKAVGIHEKKDVEVAIDDLRELYEIGSRLSKRFDQMIAELTYKRRVGKGKSRACCRGEKPSPYRWPWLSQALADELTQTGEFKLQFEYADTGVVG